MPRLLPPAVLLAAVALATALLVAALAYPAPIHIDVGAPGDAYALATFYRPEQDGPANFRWSAPGSRLLLPASYDGPLVLTLRGHAPAFAAPAARRLRLERDGVPVAELATGDTWRVYRVLLPPDAVPEPPATRLEPIELVVPVVTPGPDDPRSLGFALDLVALVPPPGAAGPLAGTLPRALSLACSIGLLAATSWFVLGRKPRDGRVIARPRVAAALAFVPAGLTVRIGAALALWAWRAPLGFAWAVPTPPLPLIIGATAALLALLALFDAGQLTVSKLVARALRWWRALRGPQAAIWAALAVLLVAHGLLLAPPPWSGLGALVALLLPGALAAYALFPAERGPATRGFLAICGALLVAPLLVLALHALPGAPPAAGLLLAANGLSAAMLWLVWREAGVRRHKAGNQLANEPPGNAPRVSRSHRLLLALGLLVALGLRFWRLEAAEFQGDEARAMLLAAGVAQGVDGLLLTHTKGPVEALLPAGPLILAGVGAEWVARLPFALASFGVLLGTLALLDAWRVWEQARPQPVLLDGGRVAPLVFWLTPLAARLPPPGSHLLALSLLVVDGFAVGFGRIVQYQSMVMLAMAGALWCCWRFYAGSMRPTPHLMAAAALLAVGLLAHYDALVVVPALAWLVLAGARRRAWRAAEWFRQLAPPLALGVALLASFYGPYLLSENFVSTAAYLAGRAGQGDNGGPPFNNLALYMAILGFYNAPPLAPLLAVGLLLSIAILLVRHVQPRPLGWAGALVLFAAALTQWLAPQLFSLPGGANWAGIAFGLPLAGLCFAPGLPAPLRAAGLWFVAAFGAQAFLIAEPRTHFYTAHIPAALLMGLAGMWPAARPALALATTRLATLTVALLLVGGSLYGQLVYLRQFPEYQRVYPAARLGWLPTPFGDTLPEAGYFGFPHRDGWKAAAELYRSGALQGSYATNQNRWLAGWYLRGATLCSGQPDLYLIAEAEPTVYFPPGYHLIGEISVGPARALTIYGRTPVAGTPPRYAVEELVAAFDSRRVASFPVAATLNNTPPACE